MSFKGDIKDPDTSLKACEGVDNVLIKRCDEEWGKQYARHYCLIMLVRTQGSTMHCSAEYVTTESLEATRTSFLSNSVSEMKMIKK